MSQTVQERNKALVLEAFDTLELFPFKIRSGTKPLCVGQNGLVFAHNVSIFARKKPCTSR